MTSLCALCHLWSVSASPLQSPTVAPTGFPESMTRKDTRSCSLTPSVLTYPWRLGVTAIHFQSIGMWPWAPQGKLLHGFHCISYSAF